MLIKKLKIELLDDPAVPVLSVDTGPTSTHHSDVCASMLTAALITVARKRRQPRCPSTEEYTKKTWLLDTT